MSNIYIQHINESNVQIQCEHGILKEYQQLFSFEIEKKRFHPLVKAGKWDGVIRLIDSKGIAPKGLVPDFLKYAVDSGYEVQISPEFKKFKEEFSYNESDYGMKFPLYDYQLNAIQRVLDKKRQLIVSPTGSGKSAILAMLMRIIDVKTLIIVPNISLLAQLGSDLENYFAASGWDIEEHCYFIGDGIKPQKKHQFIISTWQSLQRLPPEWFEDFESVICDEVHGASSQVIAKIIGSCTNAFWRVGLTGTLGNSKVNEMSLKGMFGPVYKVITTKELMDDGRVSNVVIKPIILKYPEEFCKLVRGLPYDDEVDVLIKNERRNKFLVGLPMVMKGNSLYLFRFVEDHIDKLKDDFQKRNPDKQIFVVTAATKKNERERIRQLVEVENNVIILSTYSLFSTGISINNLHNVVFASPMASKIKVLQSIGRSLRLHESKSEATVYDIVDDLRGSKKKNNYALTHFLERFETYTAEKFKVNVKEIQL